MCFNVLAVDVAVLVFVPLYQRDWQCSTDLSLVFAWAGCLVSAERQCQRGSGKKSHLTVNLCTISEFLKLFSFIFCMC